MDIEEKINNEYQVSKINMTCDKVPTEIDDNILITRNGFGVLIGSAGSGKSNLVLYLLTHKRNKGLNGKFDRVYYISPSMDTIEKILEYTFPDDEKYNFLYVRFDKPLSQSFHKNFNKLRLKFKK